MFSLNTDNIKNTEIEYKDIFIEQGNTTISCGVGSLPPLLNFYKPPVPIRKKNSSIINVNPSELIERYNKIKEVVLKAINYLEGHSEFYEPSQLKNFRNIFLTWKLLIENTTLLSNDDLSKFSNSVELTKKSISPFRVLPNELIIKILSCLSDSDFDSTSQVNSNWRELTFLAANKRAHARFKFYTKFFINNVSPYLKNTEVKKLRENRLPVSGLNEINSTLTYLLLTTSKTMGKYVNVLQGNHNNIENTDPFFKLAKIHQQLVINHYSNNFVEDVVKLAYHDERMQECIFHLICKIYPSSLSEAKVLNLINVLCKQKKYEFALKIALGANWNEQIQFLKKIFVSYLLENFDEFADWFDRNIILNKEIKTSCLFEYGKLAIAACLWGIGMGVDNTAEGIAKIELAKELTGKLTDHMGFDSMEKTNFQKFFYLTLGSASNNAETFLEYIGQIQNISTQIDYMSFVLIGLATKVYPSKTIKQYKREDLLSSSDYGLVEVNLNGIRLNLLNPNKINLNKFNADKAFELFEATSTLDEKIEEKIRKVLFKAIILNCIKNNRINEARELHTSLNLTDDEEISFPNLFFSTLLEIKGIDEVINQITLVGDEEEQIQYLFDLFQFIYNDDLEEIRYIFTDFF
jgi:hypothetical protein